MYQIQTTRQLFNFESYTYFYQLQFSCFVIYNVQIDSWKILQYTNLLFHNTFYILQTIAWVTYAFDKFACEAGLLCKIQRERATCCNSNLVTLHTNKAKEKNNIAMFKIKNMIQNFFRWALTTLFSYKPTMVIWKGKESRPKTTP